MHLSVIDINLIKTVRRLPLAELNVWFRFVSFRFVSLLSKVKLHFSKFLPPPPWVTAWAPNCSRHKENMRLELILDSYITISRIKNVDPILFIQVLLAIPYLCIKVFLSQQKFQIMTIGETAVPIHLKVHGGILIATIPT